MIPQTRKAVNVADKQRQYRKKIPTDEAERRRVRARPASGRDRKHCARSGARWRSARSLVERDGSRRVLFTAARARGIDGPVQIRDSSIDTPLLRFLCCPWDRAELRRAGEALVCAQCARRYPIDGGVISFLRGDQLGEQDRREQTSRDAESSWYDTMFEGYTNAVEVRTVVARVGRPNGAILDHGAGTGRITATLARLGVPVVAVDYSAVSLRKLIARTRGYPVLALQADVRALPLRDGAVAAATSVELYEHIRGRRERIAVLRELERVLAPGAPLAISSFNYNLPFRLWGLRGNRGAREGEHLLGGDFYYVRQTRREFAGELREVFALADLVGIRNIPARTLANGIRRAGLPRTADRFLRWMVRNGWRLDIALERTPFSAATGFFWLAKVIRRR
jgi:SAM-dependent methyltransferase